MLGWNFVKFLCPFWNDKFIPLQILYICSFSWKIIPMFFFSSNNIYFAQKEPIKMKIFETFECSCQILANSLYRFRNDKLIPLQIFYLSSLHQRLFLCSFLAQRIYTLLDRSPLKWKFFIVSSARVKFCLIPYANSKVTSWFLSKFSISLHFHEILFLCSFLAQTIYNLLNRSPLKWKFLRLSNARVKFCQIAYTDCETTSWFLSKFFIPLCFIEDCSYVFF